MKKLKPTCLLIYCLLLVAPLQASEDKAPFEKVEEIIIKFKKDIGGEEHPEFRIFLVSNDSHLVIFTVEGACFDEAKNSETCGNAYTQFLTGYVGDFLIKPISVGGKWSFLAKHLSFTSRNTILIEGFSYQNEDPSCCPTKPNYSEAFIEEGELIWLTLHGVNHK